MASLKRIVDLILASVVLVAAVACDVPDHAAAGARPLWLALDYDVSGSAEGLPVLTPEQVDRIIALAERRDGAELAFGVIGTEDELLLRTSLEPVRGPLDERARLTTQNRTRVKEWRDKVVAVLRRPRNASTTDFNCSMTRLGELYFRESVMPANAEKVALVFSDAIDTAKQCKPVKFGADIRVLALGMSDARARRLGENILRFESSDAVVNALMKME